MNIFDFSYKDTYSNSVLFAFYGLLFGFIWGLFRFLLFTAFERKEA